MKRRMTDLVPVLVVIAWTQAYVWAPALTQPNRCCGVRVVAEERRHDSFTIIGALIAWVARLGALQGVTAGATLPFLTAIVVVDAVARADMRTPNG